MPIEYPIFQYKWESVYCNSNMLMFVAMDIQFINA